jgi:predicted transcriptional regulator
VTDFNTRQTVALESTSRKKIYLYLCNGIEPASVNEIASDLDEKPAGVVDDLQVLVDIGLVARGGNTFKAVER